MCEKKVKYGIKGKETSITTTLISGEFFPYVTF